MINTGNSQVLKKSHFTSSLPCRILADHSLKAGGGSRELMNSLGAYPHCLVSYGHPNPASDKSRSSGLILNIPSVCNLSGLRTLGLKQDSMARHPKKCSWGPLPGREMRDKNDQKGEKWGEKSVENYHVFLSTPLLTKVMQGREVGCHCVVGPCVYMWEVKSEIVLDLQ